MSVDEATYYDSINHMRKDFTPEEYALRERLKPVEKIEQVTPRVCATCAYGRINDGTFECIRSGGYQTDCGDLKHWYHVCKFYKREQ